VRTERFKGALLSGIVIASLLAPMLALANMAEAQDPWTGTAVFDCENLYAVSLDVNLWLGEGSKLVVKFHTYTNSYQGENIVWSGTTPDNVSFLKTVPHPQGASFPQATPVEKVRLDLTTDNTEDVISTIASFTVTKVDLEIRFMQIPWDWIRSPPWKRVALEIEFSKVPLYWALAPSW